MPNSDTIKTIINFYNCPPTKNHDTLPYQITHFNFTFDNTYEFSGKCSHCDHSFDINTGISMLVNFSTPCPKCFHFCDLNSELIQHYFSTLSYDDQVFSQEAFTIPDSIPDFIPAMINERKIIFSSLFFQSKNK